MTINIVAKSRAAALRAIFASCVAFPSFSEAADLPSWSGVQLKLYGYTNPFFPANWGEPKLGGYDWNATNDVILNGILNISVAEKSSGQVQSSAFQPGGLWKVDVILPKMVSGLVAAPLWLMSQDANSDEIDFEFLGTKGLTITAWTKVSGVKKAIWSKGATSPVIPGDLSGQRFQLGIAYSPGKAISWSVNGNEVARITPEDVPGGAFPQLPMKPFFDLWVANGTDPSWAGTWKPLTVGTKLTMQVLGYQFTPDQ